MQYSPYNISSTHETTYTHQSKINYTWRNPTITWYFQSVLNINDHILRVILVFCNSFKSKTLKMDRMAIEKRAGGVQMLMSWFSLFIFTLNLLFISSLTFFSILNNSNKGYFTYIFSSMSAPSLSSDHAYVW